MFAKFIGESKIFDDVKDSETVLAFLDTTRKSKEADPEQNGLPRGKVFYNSEDLIKIFFY